MGFWGLVALNRLGMGEGENSKGCKETTWGKEERFHVKETKKFRVYGKFKTFKKVVKSILLTYLGSSLNAVVVFNLEVTHAASFALKTTTAFNEEPKKEIRPGKLKKTQRLQPKLADFRAKMG